MPAADTRYNFALPGRQPRTFERQSRVLFLVPKLDLSAMQIVDVEGGTDPVDDNVAGFSWNQREAVMPPLAVLARQPCLERKLLLGSQPTKRGIARDRPIIGMNMPKAVFIERAETAEISRQGRIVVADSTV